MPSLIKPVALFIVAVILTACGGGNGNGSNSTANVSAGNAPVIDSQPTSLSVYPMDVASFTVITTDTGDVTYQWKKNGVAIPGANDSTYSVFAELEDNGASVTVDVSGTGGTTGSSVAVLTVLAQAPTSAGGASALTGAQPAAYQDLVISEVSACFYANVDCWFEIYNPTSFAINASAYQVKTTALGSISPALFQLPSVSIPGMGYAIVSGNDTGSLQINPQNIRIGTSSVKPFWQANGFVELIKSGITVDFVSFGASTQKPVTASKWVGQPVTALASSPTDYGKSIVRPYPITSTASGTTASSSAANWIAVNFATPAGRNDVPASAVDADGDGIPDSAEVPGGTFAGIDLYAMGARTGKKNIFIEVDHMAGKDPGILPRKEALQKVVNAFLARNIYVHFDAGTKFKSSFSPADFNLGQGNIVVPYEQCVTFDRVTCTQNTSFRRSIYDWKDERMDLRRRSVFHYMLLGNSQLANGKNGSSGLAEFVGNDLIVTMGNWGLATTSSAKLNMLINMQASTVMHELGHNLGLSHGGNDNVNYKPNYWSIMNYLYQLNGLDPNATSVTASQRWRYRLGDGKINGIYNNVCGLVASPCAAPNQFVMDYSNGSGADLDENALSESKNVGRGGISYADWDMNGALTQGSMARDLNGDGSRSVLKDHDDWSKLVFPFARRSSSTNSGASVAPTVTEQTVLNPVAADEQPFVKETAPPAWFFEQLLNLP